MADLKAAKEPRPEDGEIPRLKSRDSTKELGQVIKQIGAAPKYYGLFNGGVNTAVTGLPTKTYRGIQVNLNPREAAREADAENICLPSTRSCPCSSSYNRLFTPLLA